MPFTHPCRVYPTTDGWTRFVSTDDTSSGGFMCSGSVEAEPTALWRVTHPGLFVVQSSPPEFEHLIGFGNIL